MKFEKENSIIERLGQKTGFIASFILFYSVLFFILAKTKFTGLYSNHYFYGLFAIIILCTLGFVINGVIRK
jgi:hypothetical protein